MQLGRVIVFAKDVATLGAYYRDMLGFTEVATEYRSDEWMVLDTGGAQLALHRVPDPWNADIDITVPPAVRHGSPHKVVFVVDDVEAARDRLVARGAALVENEHLDPSESLVRCDFVDVEGNVFQIASASD